MFILDFDGTITYKDTISALFTSTIRFQNAQGRENEAEKSLKYILDEYSKDLKAFEEKNGVEKEKEGRRGMFRSLGEVVDYQRSLRDVERRSFERVSKEGIFSGLGSEGLMDLGRRAVEDEADGVFIRAGFGE